MRLLGGQRKGKAALDWWSLVHVASGFGLAILGFGWIVATLLLVAYEVAEAGLRRVKDSKGEGVFEYESWPNIVADVVVGVAGFAAAHLLIPNALRLGPFTI